MNKADLVTPANGKKLRTVDHAYPMPAVIKIKRYINLPYRGVVLTRQNVFKRDGFQCQYCGSTKDLTLDHVLPKSRKGRTTWNNLVTACKSCNSKKGDFTPEEAGLRLVNPPARPSYVMFLRDAAGSVFEEWRPFLEVSNKAG